MSEQNENRPGPPYPEQQQDVPGTTGPWTPTLITGRTAMRATAVGRQGRHLRVNCVAPGPVWTPLIPATMPPEDVKDLGKDYPLGRAAQPAELAPPYVMLASDEASYISGATIAVTGGKPMM